MIVLSLTTKFFADRSGLIDPSAVESAQDEILCALKRYIYSQSSGTSEILRWSKLVMKLTDLRSLCCHEETEFCREENTRVLAETLGSASP